MMHLNAEQFEEALLDEAPHREHLAGCAQCREALAGMRALRERLRTAYEGVRAPAELAARIRRQTVGMSQQHAGQALPLTKPRRHAVRFPRVWRYASLAAAAIVLVAAGLVMQLWPAGATAAQIELAQIHQQNVAAMAAGGSNMLCGDMSAMRAFVKARTGCSPLTPCCGAGTNVECCCVQKFRGRPVGCFVLKTPKGPVSLVVVPDKVDTLGMTTSIQVDGHAARGSSAAGSNMLACGVGGYTYCAVGNVDHSQLADVMAQVVKGR
ncbi:MAG: hypothetical protein LLG01_10510 [Planctomycetaceae bacterium]|nr:hypothetical protein [Planctomycetaceae bacterium]